MGKINPKLIVVFAIFCVSLTSITIKLSQAPPFAMLFYRLFFSVIILGMIIFARKRDELKKITLKQLGICSVVGFFFAIHILSWIFAVRNTSIASAVVISDCHPIFVVILSYLFLKERLSKKAIIGVLVAFVGCVIISMVDLMGGGNDILGDLFALSTAFSMAIYFILGKIIREQISALVYIFLINASCFVFVILAVVFTKTPLYPYPPIEYAYFITLAVLCTVVGHGLINWSLEFVKPSFVATAFLLEPIYAGIIAAFLFREISTFWQMVGGGIIIAGLYMYNKYESLKPETKDRMKKALG